MNKVRKVLAVLVVAAAAGAGVAASSGSASASAAPEQLPKQARIVVPQHFGSVWM